MAAVRQDAGRVGAMPLGPARGSHSRSGGARSSEPRPRACQVGDKFHVLPLRTMHYNQAAGRWQTLAVLVGERLSFDLPEANGNGYITLTRKQAQELRDLLEFDGHLLPPLLDADRETAAQLQNLLAQRSPEEPSPR
jgi:hypothetical protein